MSLWIANSLLLILVLIEVLIIKYHQNEEVPWREIVSNLNSGHIVLWVFRGVEIAAFHIVLQYASLDLLSGWNVILVWTFSYLAWDFCFYWMHRLHHKYGLLWAVHSIHHEGEHFSLSLGIRNSWYSSLTNVPFVVVLAIIGVPLEVFITVSSINYFIQFYNHNGFIKKSGWLEYFLVTPSHHKVHHGTNDIYLDKNFGGTFILWDQLFGTYQPEIKAERVNIGIANHKRANNIVLQNNISFLRYFGFKLREKTFEVPKKTYSSWIVGLSGVLSFILLLFYIAYENIWAIETKALYFLIVFLATLASGGMVENKVWGWMLWILNAIGFAVFYALGQFSSITALVYVPFVLLAFGVYTAYAFHQKPNKH